jgi:hypothetical protein
MYCYKLKNKDGKYFKGGEIPLFNHDEFIEHSKKVLKEFDDVLKEIKLRSIK